MESRDGPIGWNRFRTIDSDAAHGATNAALGVTRYKRRRLRDRGFGRLAARNRPTGVLIPRASDT